MSGDQLINSVKNNITEDVLRLIDEDHVDVNSCDEVSFFLFLSCSHFLTYFQTGRADSSLVGMCIRKDGDCPNSD